MRVWNQGRLAATLRRTALALALLCAPALAQRPPDQTPPELEGVGIEQKLGAQIPLELLFTDESGELARLSKYFNGQRPVILTLNYYKCPMLCGLQLNGLLDALRQIDWTPGKQFDILTVSFDPLEESALARAKKKSYLAEYGRPGAEAGWHFLTGKNNAIKPLCETVGYSYRWNEAQQEWAHGAGIIICSPRGQVMRYLGGIVFDPQTLRLSLVEASEGKVGSLYDRIFLTCFHWVSSDGKYVPAAMNLMRLGGGLTALVLAVALALFFRKDARRRAAGAAPHTPAPHTT